MPRWHTFSQFIDEAERQPDDDVRQQMVNDLLAERPHWPWVEGRRATFIYSRMGIRSVAVNLDTLPGDPPFARMTNLQGTTLWYVQLTFEADDLLDYMLAIDDPMTPLKTETDIVGRVARHWRTDPLNPLRMHTAQMDVSILRMPKARPFPDWSAMPNVPRGRVKEHRFSSAQMNFTDRKLWVYTPPTYNPHDDREYPLLILLDGQWAVGPLQIPYIADTLIKHERLEPVIIAMKQSGPQQMRNRDYISNDRHYNALLLELLPFLQSQYRIDATNLGVGGVGVGAIAAAHAALKNPAVFSHLIMLSPPLGKGPAQEQLERYAARFQNAAALPRRIFQSVGRYEQKARFVRPAHLLRDILQKRQQTRGDVDYQFAEIGSGHGLVGFRSVFPEALAHVFPGAAWGVSAYG